MRRAILGFLCGVVVWTVVASVINRGLRILLQGYAEAEPTMDFTLAMLLSRLAMAVVTSLVAGAAVRSVATDSPKASWALGLLLLAIFVPTHVSLWNSFPIWYHLFFLSTLAPLVLLGGELYLRARPRGGLTNGVLENS